jgi:tRNA G18 (ribose-2'-O)-methylase SpoU
MLRYGVHIYYKTNSALRSRSGTAVSRSLEQCQTSSRFYANLRGKKKKEQMNEIKPKSGMMQISSHKDEMFKLVKQTKGGAVDKKFLIEDQALVDEAIYSAYPLHSIVMSQSFSQSREFAEEALKFIQPEVPIYFFPDDLFKRIYASSTLPNYIAVAYTHEKRYPTLREMAKIKKSTPLVLLDSISNPSIIGSLLNVSDVFGVSGVILIKNDKQEKNETNLEQIENNSHNENEENVVEKERQLSPLELLYTRQGLRASNGSFLRVPVVEATLQEALELFSDNKFKAVCISDKTRSQVRKMQANSPNEEQESPADSNTLAKKQKPRYVICYSNDKKGLDKRLLKRCKYLASLPTSLTELPLPSLWTILLHRIMNGEPIEVNPIKKSKAKK